MRSRTRSGLIGVMASMVLISAAGIGLAGILPPGGTFIDDDGNTHEANIEAIVAEQITFGCDPVGPRYCPSDSVSRAQMASFLARALNLPDSGTDWFTDDDGNTHEDNINRVAEAEITLGCGGALYCPNDSVSRAQMASFLARALGLEPMVPPPRPTTTTTTTTTTEPTTTTTSSTTPTTMPSQTFNVSIVNFDFNPVQVTISVGDSMRWTNNGTVAHTTTSSSNWNSGNLSPESTFTQTFNSAPAPSTTYA